MCETDMQCHSSFYFIYCEDMFNFNIKIILYFPFKSWKFMWCIYNLPFTYNEALRIKKAFLQKHIFFY